MNWKKTIIIAAVSTILSALACIIYAKIYTETQLINFSKIASTINFIISSAVGCSLMSLGYKLAIKRNKKNTVAWTNVLYSILSFASIGGVFGGDVKKCITIF